MQVIPILTVINYRDTPFLTEMYFHEWQNNNKKKLNQKVMKHKLFNTIHKMCSNLQDITGMLNRVPVFECVCV